MNIKHQKEIERNKYKLIRKSIDSVNKGLVEEEVINYLGSKKNIVSTIKNKYIGIYWPLCGKIDLRGIKEYFKTPLALPCCIKGGILQYTISITLLY